jgi:GT2 family glycosyltransferase
MALWFEKIEPHPETPLACDAMNGNFALIPAEVASVVGNIEERFRHQFGDLDYALRARCAGFDVVLVPGYVGECAENMSAGTWRDPTISFAQRWRNLISPKGVPWSEWFLFTRRHYGWRFAYYSISPYLKTIFLSVISGATKARASS